LKLSATEEAFGWRPAQFTELLRIGGPGRDRTGDLFHAMEARSQLRHRPTLQGEISLGFGFQEGTITILAYRDTIVNAPHILNFFHFLSTGFSAIIDRARHLHNFSNTI
jgi:hypothetical protein